MTHSFPTRRFSDRHGSHILFACVQFHGQLLYLPLIGGVRFLVMLNIEAGKPRVWIGKLLLHADRPRAAPIELELQGSVLSTQCTQLSALGAALAFQAVLG